jgi:hypothetical protein
VHPLLQPGAGSRLLLSWSLFILEYPALFFFVFGSSLCLFCLFQVWQQPRLPHLLPSPRYPCRLSGHPAAPRNAPDKFHHLHTWAADDLDRESRHPLLIAQPQTCSLSSSRILGPPEIRSAPILRRGPISLSSHLPDPVSPSLPSTPELRRPISAGNTTEATEAGSSRPGI